jgi:hypothetical protein
MGSLADHIMQNIAGAGLSVNDKLISYFAGTFRGTGSPEGVVTAPKGSTFIRTDGGVGTTFYVKEAGTGNTGWTPFGPATSIAGPVTINPGPLTVTGGTTATDRINLGADVNLYRNFANILKTDDSLEVVGYVGAQYGTATQIRMGNFGPGGESGIQFGTALDTNLYRSAANTLKTDDTFIAAGGLFATGSGVEAPNGPGVAATGDISGKRIRVGASGIENVSGAYAGATAQGGTIAYGTGAPVNANGIDGDIYFRVDGGLLTTMYQRRAGAWVGIV